MKKFFALLALATLPLPAYAATQNEMMEAMPVDRKPPLPTKHNTKKSSKAPIIEDEANAPAAGVKWSQPIVLNNAQEPLTQDEAQTLCQSQAPKGRWHAPDEKVWESGNGEGQARAYLAQNTRVNDSTAIGNAYLKMPTSQQSLRRDQRRLEEARQLAEAAMNELREMHNRLAQVSEQLRQRESDPQVRIDLRNKDEISANYEAALDNVKKLNSKVADALVVVIANNQPVNRLPKEKKLPTSYTALLFCYQK